MADYQAHLEMQVAIKQAEKDHRNAVIKRMVEGHKVSVEEQEDEDLDLLLAEVGALSV